MIFTLKPGLKVRDYRTGAFIPPEGVSVDQHDLYFAAMVRDGDGALKAEPEAPSEKKKG